MTTIKTPSEQGYSLKDQVGFLIRKAHQRNTAIFQQHSVDEQLTPIQFSALCVIADNDNSSLTDLVQITAIDQATIRGIVSRLKKRGLIELVSDPRDQRKVIVRATREGMMLLDEMVPIAKEISDITVEKLNPSEQVALTYLLKKIIEE
ncbi:MarR family winged helix-turn-helix transcriptional regulator [Endozoicomonas arenosclerae]|uniref:MarR family winged helix-turn-helix transcriptional regulator n=1 Tax=Endozoicomonas arenosclerae TaxID=1633495 RepID=UPI00078651B4|nr:MarR family transcriptional regulator [Endozoicomonas arenosclerae]